MLGTCQADGDCLFGMYCNNEGMCVNQVGIGELCTSHAACPRNSLCLFYKPEDYYGNCTQVLSLNNDELIMPRINKVFYYEQHMEKLCRTGWYNSTTGRCYKSIKSLNKVRLPVSRAQGRSCTTNRECPTTEAEVYAACKCGYSSKGLKYCDLAGGDDEWTDAINKVGARA